MHKLLTVLVLVAGSVATASSSSQAAATVPDGFLDVPVANIDAPTALAFTPDGRMLVASQGGVLRVIEDGVLLPTAAIDLTNVTCAQFERGLLGVAVDSKFATTRYVFLFYTFRNAGSCPFGNASTPVNRVSRFVLGDDSTIDPASERVLIDNIPSTGGNHNGGDVHVGKDGYLYISVGDGGCDYAGGGCAAGNDASRDQHVLLGKILRITRSGSIPPTNPFLGPDSDRCARGATTPGRTCQETFAWGLRNPFRFAMDPNAAGTDFRINDTGQDTWEEIDAGLAGADYGWNVREGHCKTGSTTDCGAPPAGMTNPIYDYQHGACGAITAGAFIPNGVWPTEYDDDYLFVDFNCGSIFRLEASGPGTFTQFDFAPDAGPAVDLTFGPYGTTQALYYTTYGDGGQVRRISFSGSIPTAAFDAEPDGGPAPLEVSFDASASADPDGDPLVFVWQFGDGEGLVTSSPTITHTFATPGSYRVSLVVRDPAGHRSAAARQRIEVT